MRYIIVSDFGGLLWWILIKFCKTKLEEEQAEDKWSRNIFFLIVLGFIIAFLTLKVFKI